MKTTVLRPGAWLVVLIMVVSIACNLGSSPATETPPPPEIVEPTAEIAPSQEAAPDVVDEPISEPEDTTPKGLVTSLQDVKKAVIQIEAQGTFIDPQFGLVLNGAGRGSGFIIDPEGIAVTNNHVVTGSALLKVWVAGENSPRNAKVLAVSECSDLAVIDIDGSGYSYLDWYDGAIDVGMDIYVAGFPLGDPEYTLTRGIISKARASGETQWASVDSVIEYDATTNPGNSGGPVITPDGRILGIHYAGNSDTRQAYGISKTVAVRVIDQLRQGNNVDTIGVNGQAVWTEDGSLTGIWVSSVASGSPADKAGIQAGDILLMMENLVLATDYTMSDYCDILRSHNPSDTLSVQVLRWANAEVLDGQLNGRQLEVTYAYDPDVPDGPGVPEDPNVNSSDIVNPNPSGSGDFYYYSEFDGGLGDWSYFLTNGRDDGFEAGTDNSRLYFNIGEKNTWIYLIYDPWIYTDTRLDTRVENLGRNNNNVSLICRYSEKGWYEFNIANNGEWTILRFDTASNQYIALFTGGSTLINTGQGINEYTAVCNGENLTLGINGVEVKTIKDRALKEGQAGLSVSSFNVTPIVVEFDYFSVTVP